MPATDGSKYGGFTGYPNGGIGGGGTNPVPARRFGNGGVAAVELDDTAAAVKNCFIVSLKILKNDSL